MTNTLAIGDILIRSKAFGFINHVGVYLGFNTVLQNTRERGEHSCTIEEFCEGQKIQVLPTNGNPMNVLDRARRILANPQRYNPFLRNCEHTVSEAAQGRAKSWQIILGVAIAVAVLLFFIRRS